MLLSDAIRIGSAMKPQHFGGSFNSNHTASCALGAAHDARCLSQSDHDQEFTEDFMIYDARKGCHICGQMPTVTEAEWPAHLNDTHRWSREDIADEVEKVEVEIGLRPAKAPVSHTIEEMVEAC